MKENKAIEIFNANYSKKMKYNKSNRTIVIIFPLKLITKKVYFKTLA